MGELDYTVGGTNNLVEFKTAARVPITSLKAHFLPVQLGSGNPSQSNVREIRGWNSVDFNHGQINLIPKNISFIEAKLKPYTTGSDGIISGSVYKVLYLRVPKGTFYVCRDNGNKSISYVALSDEPPAVGVQTYGVITATNRYQITIDNTEGHKYLIMFGLTSYETALEGIRDIHLYVSTSINVEYLDPSVSSHTVGFPVLGKNKLDKTASLQKYRINIQGEIVAATDYCLSDYIPVVAGKNYYLSNTSGVASNACTWFFDKNKEPISRASSVTPMTTPANAAYVRCSYFRANEDTVQLELGDEATTYESYNANNIVYGGYIDPVKGELIAEYAKLVINENTPLALAYNSKQENSTRVYTLTTYTLPNVLQDRDYDCYVDKATQGASFDSDNIRWFRQGNSEFNVYIPTSLTGITTDDDDSTIYDKAHAYLQTSPITYVFRMQTPITYPLNSEQLSTLLGANSVWTNTNNVTELSYAVHDSAAIRMAKQRIVANEPHIEIATKDNFDITSKSIFQTDLRAPLKSVDVPLMFRQNGVGAPSPTNIRTFVGDTLATIWHTNDINLFHNVEGEVKYYTYRNADGVETSSQSSCYTPNAYVINSGTLLIYFGENVYHTFRVYFLDDQNDIISKSNYYSSLFGSIDLPQQCNKVQFQFLHSDMPDFSKLHIYDCAQISVFWNDVCGTIYGGHIDFVTGELVQTYYKIIIDGVNIKVNYEYTRAESNRFGGGYVYCDPLGKIFSGVSTPNVFCDILPVNPSGYQDPGDMDYVLAPYAGNLYVVFYIGRISDHPEITTKQQKIDFTNAWLQEHPATIVYELKTPITYQLTGTQLKSIIGNNAVYSGNTHDATVSYWTH